MRRISEGEPESEPKVIRSLNPFDCGGESIDGWDKIARVPLILAVPVVIAQELLYLGEEALRRRSAARNQ